MRVQTPRHLQPYTSRREQTRQSGLAEQPGVSRTRHKPRLRRSHGRGESEERTSHQTRDQARGATRIRPGVLLAPHNVSDMPQRAAPERRLRAIVLGLSGAARRVLSAPADQLRACWPMRDRDGNIRHHSGMPMSLRWSGRAHPSVGGAGVSWITYVQSGTEFGAVRIGCALRV